MGFCKQCNNLLIPQTSSGVLTFMCQQCNKTFPASNEDTLMVLYTKPREQDRYAALIANAAYDPTGKVIDKKCSKCNEYMKLVRLGVDEKIILVCKCTP